MNEEAAVVMEYDYGHRHCCRRRWWDNPILIHDPEEMPRLFRQNPHVFIDAVLLDQQQQQHDDPHDLHDPQHDNDMTRVTSRTSVRTDIEMGNEKNNNVVVSFAVSSSSRENTDHDTIKHK